MYDYDEAKMQLLEEYDQQMFSLKYKLNRVFTWTFKK